MRGSQMIDIDSRDEAGVNGSAGGAHATDAQLIERLRQNDFDALGKLFDRYYVQVYRTALAITRDEAFADDIAQDCFLKLHQYAQRIDTSLPLAPWLYRVTVNLSYSWITRRQKRRVSIETVVDQLMSPTWYAPEHLAEQDEVQRHVRAAVEELPRNQRDVVLLYYLGGHSIEEIAHILDCPLGTVKSRLHYARETLRARLSQLAQDIISSMYEVSHGYSSKGFAGLAR
jgi:RNA polymerase sigma-70 factor (ECF subfamily)